MYRVCLSFPFSNYTTFMRAAGNVSCYIMYISICVVDNGTWLALSTLLIDGWACVCFGIYVCAKGIEGTMGSAELLHSKGNEGKCVGARVFTI